MVPLIEKKLNMKKNSAVRDFTLEAERVLAMKITCQVNALGGYGENGEVIYDNHPNGCPSVLLDNQGPATVTFISNGSVEFNVHEDAGTDVSILDPSFDTVTKREIGVPSANIWLSVSRGRKSVVSSLMNPNMHNNCPAQSTRIIKIGDPCRSMWYISSYKFGKEISYETAVKLCMVTTDKGPALLREVYIKNSGVKNIAGDLWTYFNMHGTQYFAYNKDLWYDRGLPLTMKEAVICASVPYSDRMQIKRVSSDLNKLTAVNSTCDYSSFIGDTSASAWMPEAVLSGKILSKGAGKRYSRFSTAAICANHFSFDLNAGENAVLRQSLLYVTDNKVMSSFRKTAEAESPRYTDMANSFKEAGRTLVKATDGVKDIRQKLSGLDDGVGDAPFFRVTAPKQATPANYANSLWIGVKELYENCRAHGAKLAGGIELGTRDRAQDMWPKMKEDPGRVKVDLIHALGFMYVTGVKPPVVGRRPLTLPEKLYGMFPRQYPSQWDNRHEAVANDNRPYTDSPVWLINALNMYIRETGDITILGEEVTTIRLTDPEHPEVSSIIGNDKTQTVLEVVLEIFSCFERHVKDSPYGVVQILYGEWCDPVDMYGTSIVGDDTTRGHGRGAQLRLSAHVFDCLVETIDMLSADSIAETYMGSINKGALSKLKKLADRLRQNIVSVAWEDGNSSFHAGFISCIHELKKNGKRPAYSKGDIGYTLGSMRGLDFDGRNRREIGVQAYGLNLLLTNRDYLTNVPDTGKKIKQLLKTIDKLFYNPKLGLSLFTIPIANNQKSIDLVGRMGLIPAGCAENGEYHHGQAFMHKFRFDVPGEANTTWKQFLPLMSALRDESINGPFEMPCTSYASDSADPHFGSAMYFGLSGSTDWIVEIFNKVAGLELALHNSELPDIKVSPNLPDIMEHEFSFERIIHKAQSSGKYKKIPVRITVSKSGTGNVVCDTKITVNGRKALAAEVKKLGTMKQVEIEIIRVCS